MRTLRAIVLLALILFAGVGTNQAQDKNDIKNTVGMEFVLVHPGTMQVGVFKPTCPDPNQPQGIPPAFAQRGQAAGAPPPAGAVGAAPAGAAGAPSAGARGGGRAPRDPRASWSAEDYQKCAELVKQDSTDGFPVTIKSPFYIGKYEVTQEQWQHVMGNNPSIFQGPKVKGDIAHHPVDNVTWQDAQNFVKKLNSEEKTKSYHLPTEFQWEYACRAGGAGQQSWAYIRATAVQGVGGGFGAGATGPPPEYPTTEVVGSKKPNDWGIYDMLGNVWEWVQDPYNDKLFADPVPAKTGTEHVLKGGGFAADVKNTICATHGAGPGDKWDVGFRVVKDTK